MISLIEQGPQSRSRGCNLGFVAEASNGGQPAPDGGEPTPGTGSDNGDSADSAQQNPGNSTNEDGEAPADPAAPVPTWAEIGRVVGAVLTVLAALGGLVLGVRAEQRADREERRAEKEERRADREEKRAAELSRKAFAEWVDFYRTPSAVVVMNGNPHPMHMRLILPEKDLWWDLSALEPCKQIKIPNDTLRASMREAVPSVRVADAELSSLWLEFQDPEGRSWVRGGSKGTLVSSEWDAGPGVNWVDLGETWNKAPEDSPICGAP